MKLPTVPANLLCRYNGIIVTGSHVNVFTFQSTVIHFAPLYQGYFDTARLELAEHNIGVQIVCPGPVQSQLSKYAFTDDVNVVSNWE